MCDITLLAECVIKVEEIKEEEEDTNTENVEYRMQRHVPVKTECWVYKSPKKEQNILEEEEPNDDSKDIGGKCLGNVSVKKEFCTFLSTDNRQCDSEEEELKPLVAVFVEPKEETEDDSLEKDPLASSDNACHSAPVKDEIKCRIPDAVSRCAEEVAVPPVQQIPAVLVKTEGGTSKSAVGAPPPATRLSDTTLCQSDLSDPSASDPQMRSSLIKKQYRCQYCSCVFTRLSLLNGHTRNSHCSLDEHKHHTGLKRYKCTKCDYTAAKRFNLKVHLQIHSGIKPYKCTECDFTAAQSTYLKRHQRIHNEIRPFKCTECDFRAAHSSPLKKHQRIHEFKPYKCEECNFTTVHGFNLKVHQRIHSGIKPYKCTQCEFRTAHSSNLKVHQRVHTGIKPYKYTKEYKKDKVI